jgi:hypothetical protein
MITINIQREGCLFIKIRVDRTESKRENFIRTIEPFPIGFSNRFELEPSGTNRKGLCTVHFLEILLFFHFLKNIFKIRA